MIFAEIRTTSYGLSSFSYVSAKLRNALTNFIRTTEFIGFKRECRVTFCTSAIILCILAVNVMSRKILALVVIMKFEMK